MKTRPFDIILIGATGFTGRRAARYLKTHGKGLRIGLAARNSERLNILATELGYSADSAFVVNTLQKEQVDRVTALTKIVISTAGPFSLYGEQVIASCVEHGTHYLDITGEVDFIHEMIEKYGEMALQNKCKLIPFSGFDSVPADITAYLLSTKFESPKELNIKSYYKISGGFNGGTIASMMNKFESGDFKSMNNPHLIMHGSEQQISSQSDSNALGFNTDIKRWTAPFIMGAINSKVVYRSASLFRAFGQPYADAISYSEHSSFGKRFNPFSFIILTTLLIALKVLGPYSWFRTLVKKIAPNPGEGPSEKTIEEGFFKLKAIAKDQSGNEKSLTMSYSGDPGNKSTVFFLCESALALLDDQYIIDGRFGFLTTTTAFKSNFIGRLTDKGLKIS